MRRQCHRSPTWGLVLLSRRLNDAGVRSGSVVHGLDGERTHYVGGMDRLVAPTDGRHDRPRRNFDAEAVFFIYRRCCLYDSCAIQLTDYFASVQRHRCCVGADGVRPWISVSVANIVGIVRLGPCFDRELIWWWWRQDPGRLFHQALLHLHRPLSW